jgi:hypothetical protein
MGIVTVTTFSSDTETVTRTKLNGLASNLLNEFNGEIDNANIASDAAIAASKLNLATITEAVSFTGAVTLGNAAGDAITVTGTATFAETIEFTDETSDIGTSSVGINDLHFGSGGIINWDGGDITLTHSAAKLTFGGDGAVEIDFNNHEMTNVDINSGAIDGVTIGGTSAPTVTNLGTVTTCDINGGTIGGITFDGALTMTLGSDADGDMYYRSSNVLTRLAKGTNGQVLKSDGSVPSWGSPGIVYVGTDNWDNAANSADITVDGTEGNIIIVMAEVTGDADGGGSGTLRIELNNISSGYGNGFEVQVDSSDSFSREWGAGATDGFGSTATVGESKAAWIVVRIYMVGQGRCFADFFGRVDNEKFNGNSAYLGGTAITSVRAKMTSENTTGDIWVWEGVA